MVTDRRTALAFLATSVLFGGTFVAAKGGLEYFPPLLFLALRFDIAAIALLGYVALTHSRSEALPRTRADVLGILATGLIALGATNALLFVGQQYATSAVGAILFSLNPVLTPLFAALLLSDEHLSARGAVGIAVGLAGVALVVNPDPAMLFGGAGTVLLFGGAVAGAAGAVLIRRADSTVSSTVRTAWALPLAAGVVHIASLARGDSPAAVVWTPTALLALAYVALFAGALAYVAYFDLLDRAGAIRANLAFYLVPVVATVGGWVLLGESVSPMAVVGFVVIFAGFAVIASQSVNVGAWVPATLRDRVATTGNTAGFDDSFGVESD